MSEFTDAIRAGDAARAVALATADPRLFSETENGVTPLLLALYHGRRDVALALAAADAPVSFCEACALGDEKRVETFLASDPQLVNARSADGFPALGLAAFFGQGALARRLIEAGADVDAASDNATRVAPLHAAAAVCDRETMAALLAKGADPNARQQMDYTPLHTAASRGDIAMAELLLSHGADRGARGSDGLEIEEVARKYGKEDFLAWWQRIPEAV
jgi:ankyrin repeat protein